MQVHLVQHDIVWESPTETIAHVRTMLEAHLVAPGDLVVLPEMFATGFSMNAAKVGEAADGGTTSFLQEIAQRGQVFVIGGVPVVAPSGRVQNQAVCVNPQGEVVARYAKMQPFSISGENKNYEAGSAPAIFDWNGLKVAPLICYDLRFPEVFRAATKLGAEMFCVIANWPATRAAHWDILLPARALENQAYLTGVNRVGRDPVCQYNGRSRVLDPNGCLLADAGEVETILSCAIDPENVRTFRAKLPFLRDMRSDLLR